MTALRLRASSRLRLATAAACITFSTAAIAETDEVNRALAQTLFDEARQLMQADRFSEACPKLVESQRLDPAGGTLLNLALCHEQEGKTASAWVDYNEALALAAREGDAERKKFAEERVSRLLPLLSRVVVRPPANPPSDLWVSLDSVRLARSAFWVGVPVDPGRHVLEYGASGKSPSRLVVKMTGPGETKEVSLGELEDVEPRRSPKHLVPRPPPAPRVSPPWVRVGAAYGLSAWGLAATAYFGSRAKSAWDERNRLCPEGERCPSNAISAGERANAFAWGANASAAVAVVGAALGTYWLVRPKTQGAASANAVATGFSAQGAMLTGRLAF